MKKIALFANDDFYLKTSRLSFIRELKEKGWEVFACGLKTDQHFVELLIKSGAIFVNLPLKRGVKIFSSIRYFFRVFFLCRREKFDLTHNFSFKPVVLATLAQRAANIKNIFCSITGLGYVFSSSSLKACLLRLIATIGYKIAASLTAGFVFQNYDDLEYFTVNEITCLEKSTVIVGSGVDTDYFSKNTADLSSAWEIRKNLNIGDDAQIAVLVSRLLKQKGIREFAAAAKILKKKNKNWNFLLVGPVDKSNPESIKEKEIEKWRESGIVHYLGGQKNIREILRASDVFVFPSYYKEGAPKVVLEAMAMGLPVVAAENAGTKELVSDNFTGLLAKPKDAADLAEKIEKIFRDKNLAFSLGREGRERAVKFFSDKVVNKKTLDFYEKISAETATLRKKA